MKTATIPAVQHTPTPWHAVNTCPYANPQPDYCAVADECHDVLAKLNPHTPKSLREANAAFIVQACNSYGPLVAAIERVAEIIPYGYWGIDTPSNADDVALTLNHLITRARETLASLGLR